MRTVLAFVAAICLGWSSSATAQKGLDLAFQADQHVYLASPAWHPAAMSPQGLSKLSEALGKLPLPSFAVVVRSESAPPDATAVRMLDDLVDRWVQQGLPDRHAVMLLLWGEDCPLPARRPGHDRCDYAVAVGAAVRIMGITPASAGALAVFDKAVSHRPVDPIYGINQALRMISDTEREATARESLERTRTEADLDSAISLLYLLADDPSANREERSMLLATANQAQTARATGSTHIMREAQTLIESQVRLWVRLQDERRRVRTFRGAAATALGASLFLLVLFFFLRARRRLGGMTKALDPAVRDLEHYRDRFERALAAVKSLVARTRVVRAELPKGATSAHLHVDAAEKLSYNALRHIEAATAHIRVCEAASTRSAMVMALFTGSCPGSDLSRQLRATYRVDIPSTGSQHDVFGSATRTRFFRLETAEEEVGRFYDEAALAVGTVEDAVKHVRGHIKSCQTGAAYEALCRRAETLRVPSVWLSNHPYLTEGSGFFDVLGALASENPVEAMERVRTYEQRHEAVAATVERIGAVMARVVSARVADLRTPEADKINLDPADNPRNTLQVAAFTEEMLQRLVEAPMDLTSDAAIAAKAAEVVGLYEKAIAQHGVIIRALQHTEQDADRADERLAAVSNLIPAVDPLTVPPQEIQPRAGRIMLAHLRMQTVRRDMVEVRSALSSKRYVRAMRTLEMAMSEIDRIEEVVGEDAGGEVSEAADGGSSGSDKGTSGGSIPPPKEGASGGTIPPPKP